MVQIMTLKMQALTIFCITILLLVFPQFFLAHASNHGEGKDSGQDKGGGISGGDGDRGGDGYGGYGFSRVSPGGFGVYSQRLPVERTGFDATTRVHSYSRADFAKHSLEYYASVGYRQRDPNKGLYMCRVKVFDGIYGEPLSISAEFAGIDEEMRQARPDIEPREVSKVVLGHAELCDALSCKTIAGPGLDTKDLLTQIKNEYPQTERGQAILDLTKEGEVDPVMLQQWQYDQSWDPLQFEFDTSTLPGPGMYTVFLHNVGYFDPSTEEPGASLNQYFRSAEPIGFIYGKSCAQSIRIYDPEDPIARAIKEFQDQGNATSTDTMPPADGDAPTCSLTATPSVIRREGTTNVTIEWTSTGAGNMRLDVLGGPFEQYTAAQVAGGSHTRDFSASMSADDRTIQVAFFEANSTEPVCEETIVLTIEPDPTSAGGGTTGTSTGGGVPTPPPAYDTSISITGGLLYRVEQPIIIPVGSNEVGSNLYSLFTITPGCEDSTSVENASSLAEVVRLVAPSEVTDANRPNILGCSRYIVKRETPPGLYRYRITTNTGEIVELEFTVGQPEN